MSYFYKTVPIFKSALWGGQNLKRLGKKTPEMNISESWELCTLPENENIAANGDDKDKKLKDIIKNSEESFLGKTVNKKLIDNNDVPFLLKFIDANDSLSVQVHPDDDYAYVHENGSLGKTEMWYVIDAEPHANVIYGFNQNLNKENIIDSIKNGEFEGIYRKIPVKKGDTIFVPSGTVHALNKGIVVAEIQEQSDLTYRLFDYNRIDKDGNKRKLHIEKALDVISYENKKPVFNGLTITKKNYSARYLALSKYFCVKEVKVHNAELKIATRDNFHAVMLVDGYAYFKHESEILNAQKLDTIVIPAYTGHYSAYGNFTALDIFVPDPDNIYTSLIDAGYTMKDIYENIGGTVDIKQ